MLLFSFLKRDERDEEETRSANGDCDVVAVVVVVVDEGARRAAARRSSLAAVVEEQERGPLRTRPLPQNSRLSLLKEKGSAREKENEF